MDALSGNNSDMVFKQVIKENMEDVSFDHQLLRVFLAFDGKKTLNKVAQESSINMGAIGELISKLLKLELIEPVHKDNENLDHEFIEFLNSQLSLAVGPIAQVLIEDVAAEMGFALSKFPSSQAAEIVDLLARQIKREEKKANFEQNMINKIREKGY